MYNLRKSSSKEAYFFYNVPWTIIFAIEINYILALIIIQFVFNLF